MRSIFEAAPYGRYDLGRYGLPTAHPSLAVRVRKLGQDASDVGGLIGAIDDLLKLVPDELLGKYEAEKQRCRNLLEAGGIVGLAAGGRCLYSLFQELKDVVEGEGGAAPVPARSPALPRPASSGFPILPVAIAGVAAVGLVAVLLTVGK
jgi:hypothetical protein